MVLRQNVGGVDRALRVGVGLVLLPIGLAMLAAHCLCGWVNVGLGVAGLVSGLTGFCVFYVPFGVSTARRPAGVAGSPDAAAGPR